MTDIQICNLALGHLGELGKVASIVSVNTAQETFCAQFYPVARQKTLVDGKPSFAVRKALLTIYDEDHLDAILNGEWQFAYAQPTGLIDIMKVLPEGASKNRPSEDFSTVTWLPVAMTPLSTDNAADTVTFEDEHSWVTGTIVTPLTTGGGLTAGTSYYIGKVDANTVSFHLTLAAAVAGTGKVAITSVTAILTPIASETAIVTNVEDAWLDFVYDVTDTNLFTTAFLLPFSYKLAALLAGPIVKGKNGIQLGLAMEQQYKLHLATLKADTGNNKQISDTYKNHRAPWSRGNEQFWDQWRN